MGLFVSTKIKKPLNWRALNSVEMIDDLINESHDKPILILKHSTRCSISSMAKNRIELYWDNEDGIEPIYLDLLSYRDISNTLAEIFNVKHESPQVLLIKNGACIYHASHTDVDYNTIKSHL